ncbi:hypothetical protein FEZ32_05910 [Acidipropionibacterium jensenii]|uniref:hypothetical protein n=1 Tax=Acidipropionibacterium jensenii TaxID=1749 RepID=UPI00110BD914|nr:hypothetical protein [Acidipropionibacterium jensenii]QCV87956.1 hypothetical protein FEZ32_05910 [Acidipropionibacterium jensenii]
MAASFPEAIVTQAPDRSACRETALPARAGEVTAVAVSVRRGPTGVVTDRLTFWSTGLTVTGAVATAGWTLPR